MIDTSDLSPMVLRMLLEKCWMRETSYDPELWRKETPSTGQCAVTAMIVQDYCGGEIINATVNNTSHYWNRIEATDADLTEDQFGNDTLNITNEHVIDRSELEKNATTIKRYNILKKRLEKQI